MQFAIRGKFAIHPIGQGAKKMPHDGLMQSIGRIERALTRLEAVDLKPSPSANDDPELAKRHEALKSETRAAIGEIDRLLAGMGG